MKKLISVVFLFVLSVCLLGCIDNPNGPHTIVPYGVYENEGLISAYPYQVTQEYSSKNKKFEIEEAIPGIVGDALMEFLKKPRIISLDSIKCDSLKELFKINLSAEKIEEEYLKENFKALWFIREEPVDAKELEDIVYLDLFVIIDAKVVIK